MKPYYHHGGITIYCGDCRDILPALGRFDLCLTDPPYGIGRLMKGGKNTGHWGSLSAGNEWDIEPPDLGILETVSEKRIIWGGNFFPLPPTRCVLIWRKLNAVPTQAGIEMAWTNLDKCAQAFAWPSGGAIKRHGHPTEKPKELMTWCLSFAPEVKTIIDPFAGSLTTARAAKDLGLQCVCIEREERYCELGVKRLEQECLPFSQPVQPIPNPTLFT